MRPNARFLAPLLAAIGLSVDHQNTLNTVWHPRESTYPAARGGLRAECQNRKLPILTHAATLASRFQGSSSVACPVRGLGTANRHPPCCIGPAASIKVLS